MSTALRLPTGVFTLSFDLELAWGTLDLQGPGARAAQLAFEREVVIDRLLAALSEFAIGATWGVIGHLLLEQCDRLAGTRHPEIVRPRHAWSKGDWFGHDPGGDERDAPAFFGRSLVRKILACSAPQEIGCHSFSHVIFGDAGCSREAAWSDVAASVRAAGDLGIGLRSFVFPRNRVGHLDVLAQLGFRCYRGPERAWHRGGPLWGSLETAVHGLELLAASSPPMARPVREPQGLWNLPGSMVLLPRNGVKRLLPATLWTARALKGLEAAARTRSVFHLWTHPTNFVEDVDTMLGVLRATLERASRLRDAGSLQVLTMGALADRCEGLRSGGRDWAS